MDEPSGWVRRFAPLIRPGGTVLDVACGAGRHTRMLRSLGLRVVAVDRDRAALDSLVADEDIQTVCADLEGGPWPFDGRVFDGVVVTNYLHRPLFSALRSALGDGGVLIYETFAQGNARFGKPSNPAFLLRRDELLREAGDLQVIAFEQGEVGGSRPAVVQRLCAVRAVFPHALAARSGGAFGLE